jgi:glutamate-1-semialdehyde aminotransferase
VSQAKNIIAPVEPARPRARQPKFQRSTNRSRLKGVYAHGKHGYRALICIHGKLTHLGTFSSRELAAAAYSAAAECRESENVARKVEAAKRLLESIERACASIENPIARRRFESGLRAVAGVNEGQDGSAMRDAK